MADNQPVASSNYPYLALRFVVRGREAESSALVDTGFTGDLVVPPGIFDDEIGLPDTRLDWELADGSSIDAPVYLGTVEIIGLPPMLAIVTILGNECILGRGIIDRFRVIFDHGQRVIVEP